MACLLVRLTFVRSTSSLEFLLDYGLDSLLGYERGFFLLDDELGLLLGYELGPFSSCALLDYELHLFRS